MSTRMRLVLTFSACFSLVYGSIVYIVFSSTRASANEAFHTLATSQLERVEERIKTFLEPGTMSVKYLAGLDLVRDSRGKLTSYLDTTERTTLRYANHSPYEQRIYDEFIRVSHSNDNYGLVFMANNDGQYAQAPEGQYKNPGYDPRLRSWYIESIQDENDVTVTSPYLTTGGGMVCSIMVKTYDLNHEPLGLLGVDYSLQSLTRDLDERRIMDTGYLVTFDRGGHILSDGHHPELVAQNPETYPEFRKNLAAAPDGVFPGIGSRGIREYIVTHTVEPLGWKLVVIFEESELLASSYDLLRTILTTSGIVFLLAFGVMTLLARSFVRPLEELIEASAIISSGEYEKKEEVRESLMEKLNHTGQGESRKLANALRSMFEIIEERIDAVQAANTAKGNFLANMSHEIRTLMNAIVGMTNLARSATDIDRKNYCLDKIESASAPLLEIINDVLDMSKIEANKFDLSMVKFNLEKVLQKTVNVIESRMEEKQQTFNVFLDPNIPPVLEGDDRRVTQVITNLLSNAIKFTPEHGRIQVAAKLVKEDAGTSADPMCTIQISVSDSGIGISEEQQGCLFSAFQQANSGISRRFGGTGLGLAISKQIVEMMGGSIRVSSKPGEGSIFSFTIQVKCVSKDPEEEIPSPASGGGVDNFKGFTILLADDIEINREIVLALLEPTQVEVDCAENGAEALRMFQDHPEKYDLILMDVHMPEMDGYEATCRIRAFERDLKNHTAGPVPIIAMTASVFRQDIEKCQEAGMNAHLGKPLDFTEVLVKIRQYLGTSSKT